MSDEDRQDRLDDEFYEPAPNRGRKILVWLILIALGLPLLFYVFEYVVPRFLPANF